jgi:hypothetical protein
LLERVRSCKLSFIENFYDQSIPLHLCLIQLCAALYTANHHKFNQEAGEADASIEMHQHNAQTHRFIDPNPQLLFSGVF